MNNRLQYYHLYVDDKYLYTFIPTDSLLVLILNNLLINYNTTLLNLSLSPTYLLLILIDNITTSH